MIAKIIGSLLIIGFFLILNQVRKGLLADLGDSDKLSKAFAIGSFAICTFFIFLIFTS